MFKKLCFTLALGLSLYASNLSVSSSAIMAQTEVFGDSQITPITRDNQVCRLRSNLHLF